MKLKDHIDEIREFCKAERSAPDPMHIGRVIDFHDKAVEALRYVSENIDCEPEWDIAKVAERALALLDKEVE